MMSNRMINMLNPLLTGKLTIIILIENNDE